MTKSALRLSTIAKPNRSKATLRAPMETMQSDSSAIFTRVTEVNSRQARETALP